MDDTDNLAAEPAAASETPAAIAAGSGPPPLPADDSCLLAALARVVRQDEQALAELYDALAGRVYGLALRIVRQVQTAEEVTRGYLLAGLAAGTTFRPAARQRRGLGADDRPQSRARCRAPQRTDRSA